MAERVTEYIKLVKRLEDKYMIRVLNACVVVCGVDPPIVMYRLGDLYTYVICVGEKRVECSIDEVETLIEKNIKKAP